MNPLHFDWEDLVPNGGHPRGPPAPPPQPRQYPPGDNSDHDSSSSSETSSSDISSDDDDHRLDALRGYATASRPGLQALLGSNGAAADFTNQLRMPLALAGAAGSHRSGGSPGHAGASTSAGSMMDQNDLEASPTAASAAAIILSGSVVRAPEGAAGSADTGAGAPLYAWAGGIDGGGGAGPSNRMPEHNGTREGGQHVGASGRGDAGSVGAHHQLVQAIVQRLWTESSADTSPASVSAMHAQDVQPDMHAVHAHEPGSMSGEGGRPAAPTAANWYATGGRAPEGGDAAADPPHQSLSGQPEASAGGISSNRGRAPLRGHPASAAAVMRSPSGGPSSGSAPAATWLAGPSTQGRSQGVGMPRLLENTVPAAAMGGSPAAAPLAPVLSVGSDAGLVELDDGALPPRPCTWACAPGTL